MGDYLPKHKPGQAFSRQASAAVTGGRLITVAGAQTAADSTTWLGVASHDAAIGQDVGVYCDGVQKLVASATIAAGDRVKCAADGKVATLTAGTDAYDRLVGIALEAATADGDVILVKLAR